MVERVLRLLVLIPLMGIACQNQPLQPTCEPLVPTLLSDNSDLLSSLPFGIGSAAVWLNFSEPFVLESEFTYTGSGRVSEVDFLDGSFVGTVSDLEPGTTTVDFSQAVLDTTCRASFGAPTVSLTVEQPRTELACGSRPAPEVVSVLGWVNGDQRHEVGPMIELEDGDTNVPRDTGTLGIYFDQPMSTSGISICGAGGYILDSSQSEGALFLTVSVAPNTDYAISLNCPSSSQGIRSVCNEPLPWTLIEFTTGS